MPPREPNFDIEDVDEAPEPVWDVADELEDEFEDQCRHVVFRQPSVNDLVELELRIYRLYPSRNRLMRRLNARRRTTQFFAFIRRFPSEMYFAIIIVSNFYEYPSLVSFFNRFTNYIKIGLHFDIDGRAHYFLNPVFYLIRAPRRRGRDRQIIVSPPQRMIGREIFVQL